jgi:hypothetical protein
MPSARKGRPAAAHASGVRAGGAPFQVAQTWLTSLVEIVDNTVGEASTGGRGLVRFGGSPFGATGVEMADNAAVRLAP